jgi:hypothetical protein
MNHDERGLHKFKTVVTYSALGLGTATGMFMLARFLYKKAKKNSIEKNSLSEGDPATFARQLKMAFDNDNWMGWGTNNEMVMQVFRQIPTKSAYQKVQNAYFGLYNKSLTAELESELTSDEYNEVIRILSVKR